MQALRKRALTAALAFAFIALGAAAATKERRCVDWQKLMTSYAVEHMPKGKTISVESFRNYTGQPGDDWLSYGIKDLLADMLRSSSDHGVLSGRTAQGGAGAPDLRVGGTYQHANGMLRVFVTISDGRSGAALKQLESLSPYPENKDFFTGLAKAAEGILKFAKAKYDPGELAAVREVTSSTRAYESYARGRQAMAPYNPSSAEVAQTFFADAKRADYRSPLGYLGLADLHTFVGFAKIQSRGSGAPSYQAAEEELGQMRKLAGARAPAAMFHSAMAGAKGGAMVNRFLVGNASSVEGQQLELAGNRHGAREAFKKALEAVPEDALTWYYLSRVELALGDSAASTAALQKAYSINPCVEGR